MVNRDQDTPADREPGCDEAVALSKRRWLVVGLVLAAVGTVVNKVLGFALSGRVLVAAGAVAALVAIGRPTAMVAVDRTLTHLCRRLGIAPDPGEEDTR